MEWKDKSVLITGATGLVGFWLTEALLEKGASICCLVRDRDAFFEKTYDGRVSIVSGTLELETIERALCEYEVDTVFHLAAQTLVGIAKRAPLLTFESNVRGSYLLFEACRRQARYLRSIVVASSDKAYGTAPLPYTERVPLRGEFPYDVSKTCTDLIAQSYVHTYDLPLNVLRCGNIYGGFDQNWSRIVPGTIRSVLENKSPLIRSDGSFVRDYFYVKDAANAYIAVAESERRGEAFNFGSEAPCTVLTITKKILKLMDSDLEPVILDEAKAEIQEQYLCCKKAHEMLNWEPKFSLDEGLEETIEWYKSHKDAFERCETYRAVASLR
ncbi:MAG: GDP-mannose 4,6-dehydratase [Chlamydiales bacterium]|nr:GDP-mannose 4,6-dehydratase [Chlamydiales bacterium]